MGIRKVLSAQGLTQALTRFAGAIRDPRSSPWLCTYKITDFILSAFAMHFLNFRSALQFDQTGRPIDATSRKFARNMLSLFSVGSQPSDTRIREVLDSVDPAETSRILDKLVNIAQQGKVLKHYKSWDETLLVAVDGVEFFSSEKISCPSCCIRQVGNKVGYYHQALVPAIVSCTNDHLLYLPPEIIQLQDGSSKNDCEINAFKRLIPTLRLRHPHLSMTLLLDGLYSKAVVVQIARDHGLGFVIVAKPGDHSFLFSEGINEAIAMGRAGSTASVSAKRVEFEFFNDIPLNASSNVRINLLVEKTFDEAGVLISTWSWITDTVITIENAEKIALQGHRRWCIENGGFNRGKNRSTNLAHNFGHGNLSLFENDFILQLAALSVHNLLEITDQIWIEAGKIRGRKGKASSVTTESAPLIDRIRPLLSELKYGSWRELLGWLLNIAADVKACLLRAIAIVEEPLPNELYARPPPAEVH